jgi:NADPH:quinone reductase-like Zn-dependent oxidoreductase
MQHRRLVVTHYGGPDALQVLVEDRPEPRQGQVLVRVRVLCAGVSLPDVMAREGIPRRTRCCIVRRASGPANAC